MKGENTEELVVQLIAESMGLTVGPDIDTCHLYGRTGSSRLRPVIIRFTKISTRDLVLQNAKRFREGNRPTNV